jgi:polysaccharide export outer membrane protein
VLTISLMGVASLLWFPGVLPAAWQQQIAGADKAGAAAGVDLQASPTEETLISVNDVLFVQVFDVEQMTREYRVSGGGGIDFPLLPQPVQVAGLTPQRAAQAIAQKCIEAGVLSHPQISVTIRESRLHSVSVGGAVKNPQIYPVFGRIALLDILTQAGGVADDAGPVVIITRGEVSRRALAAEGGNAQAAGDAPPAPATVNINLKRLAETGDPSLNVAVYPGDHVTVPRAGVVYVVGAVGRPGAFLLSDARQDMTVLRALALAGSLGPWAKSKKAVLLRPDPSAPKGRDEIPINLQAMLKGEISDRPLQSNDILFVPDSTMLKALHRGADITAMGVSYAGAAAVMP